MNAPKLILLNGFAGSGKTTIAKRYIDEHPLALVVEGDEIIVHMGQWEKYENEARSLIFKLTQALANTHLAAGHDVVLPYLLTYPEHAAAFEQIATAHGAAYHEIIIFDEKTDAIARLLKRGTWGEAGLAPLTEKDLPVIEDLYDRMTTASDLRHMKVISPVHGDIDGSYRRLLELIT